MEVLITYLIYWMVIGGIGGLLIAAAMAKPRLGGFIVGALLGIFGWLLIILWKVDAKPSTQRDATKGGRGVAGSFDGSATRTCPQCAEEVKAAALICRFCRYQFPVSVQAAHPPAQFPTARMLRREWIIDRPTTIMSRDFGRVAAGEEVAVLDAKGKYTRIRASDGVEGWVRTKSISMEPLAKDDQAADLGEWEFPVIDERDEPAWVIGAVDDALARLWRECAIDDGKELFAQREEIESEPAEWERAVAYVGDVLGRLSLAHPNYGDASRDLAASAAAIADYASVMRRLMPVSDEVTESQNLNNAEEQLVERYMAFARSVRTIVPDYEPAFDL